MDIQKNSVKILVIDDESIVRDVICTTLEILGFNVISAENGSTGLELARNEKPDIVFTDMILPEMSGQQIIDAIRKMNPQIFVVSVSGYYPEESTCDAALQKPFTQSELKQVLNEAQNHILKIRNGS